MLARHARNQSPKPAGAEEEFRSIVASMFLPNKLSGLQMRALVKSADNAGARGVADLARYKASQNTNRDYLAALLKGTNSPSLYFANVPLKSNKTGEVESTKLPFILPHEMVAQIVDGEKLENSQQWSAEVKQKIGILCGILKTDPIVSSVSAYMAMVCHTRKGSRSKLSVGTSFHQACR